VALLNDCKYGYYVASNLIDLNLLRSPIYPDPVADRAHHQFTYALYPHPGDHIAGHVLQAGYELNMPLRMIPVQANRNPATRSYLSVDAASVIIETVKTAEDGQGMIVRLYEAHGTAAKTALRFGFAVRFVSLANLLEEHLSELPVADNAVDLIFKPFEIITLRIV
jgi:alpha-mannosidase